MAGRSSGQTDRQTYMSTYFTMGGSFTLTPINMLSKVCKSVYIYLNNSTCIACEICILYRKKNPESMAKIDMIALPSPSEMATVAYGLPVRVLWCKAAL